MTYDEHWEAAAAAAEGRRAAAKLEELVGVQMTAEQLVEQERCKAADSPPRAVGRDYTGLVELVAAPMVWPPGA